jgi:hypothetical protein
MRRTAIWILATLACVLLAAAPAAAQSHAGIRAGLSVDPEQFFFGGHVESNPLVERLTFRPNVEVGVGDDLTLVALNVEFAYWVSRQRPWDVYFGGGPALVIASGHDGRRRDDDDTDVGGGFNLLVGAQHRDGLFGEIKAGLGDSPGLKFTVGYAFR